MIHKPLAVATLAFLVGLPLAAQEPMMSVEPNPATTGDPLLVTVDSGGFFCGLLEPWVLEDMVIIIGATVFCDPQPPEPPPSLFTLVPPLTAGIWELRLVAADLPVKCPLCAIETLAVTVTDPSFGIRLDPPVATEDDDVVATVTVIGVCPEFDPVEIVEGAITIEGRESPLCIPNDPGPLDVEIPLGQLPAGDYLAELVYGGTRVAEQDLSVLPAGACVAGDTTLCLNDGRFRVQATWTHPSAGGGAATAVVETDDAGFFWFSSPDNIELVVKVLDACGTSFQSFWVFAAGLTNLGVELTVTDTATDTSVTYQNPLGTPFELIADTAAFDTCP